MIPVVRGTATYSASRREGTLTVRVDVAQPDQGGSHTPSPVTATVRPGAHRLSEQSLAFLALPRRPTRWARPTLLIVTALAGLAYAWRFDQAYLEPFYGGAARSMSLSLHNFFYGAADPWATVSVDKIPGALWIQAISLRIFGFHVWALVLPQVIEGMLTVLVLYRAVRRVAGAGAGLVAAVVLAGSPIVILLDRGNISDSLLILLLVLAADATIRACQTGRVALAVVGRRPGRPRLPGQDAAGLARGPRALLGLPRRRPGGLVPAASVAPGGEHARWWRSCRSAGCRSSPWSRSRAGPTSTGAATTRSSTRCSPTTGSPASVAGLANTAGCSRPSAYLLTLVQATRIARASEPAASARHGIACCRGPSDTTMAWLLLPQSWRPSGSSS